MRYTLVSQLDDRPWWLPRCLIKKAWADFMGDTATELESLGVVQALFDFVPMSA